MAEQRFTPGPWKSEEIRHDGKWYVMGPDNTTLVALCNSGLADNEANARLIAMSPQMYDALKEMQAAFGSWKYDEPRRAAALKTTYTILKEIDNG